MIYFSFILLTGAVALLLSSAKNFYKTYKLTPIPIKRDQ